MNDTKLYEQILGLQPPWSVQSVALKPAEGMIEIEVVCAETMWGCPECGERMHRHDSERRRWPLATSPASPGMSPKSSRGFGRSALPHPKPEDGAPAGKLRSLRRRSGWGVMGRGGRFRAKRMVRLTRSRR